MVFKISRTGLETPHFHSNVDRIIIVKVLLINSVSI